MKSPAAWETFQPIIKRKAPWRSFHVCLYVSPPPPGFLEDRGGGGGKVLSSVPLKEDPNRALTRTPRLTGNDSSSHRRTAVCVCVLGVGVLSRQISHLIREGKHPGRGLITHLFLFYFSPTRMQECTHVNTLNDELQIARKHTHRRAISQASISSNGLRDASLPSPSNRAAAISRRAPFSRSTGALMKSRWLRR